MSTVLCENIIKVESSREISTQFSSLFLNQASADTVFILGNDRLLPAHRKILTRQSTYFNKKKYIYSGKMVEFQVNLKRIKLRTFKAVLNYFYNDQNFNCTTMPIVDTYDALLLAKMYEIPMLVDQLTTFLIDSLSLDNLANYSKEHNFIDLTKATCNFLECNARAFVNSENFQNLTEDALVTILQLNYFPAKEIEILEAILKWQSRNATIDMRKILSLIRFSLIPSTNFINVLAAEYFRDTDLLGVINSNLKTINSRGLLPEVNLATLEFGAKYIEGDNCINRLLTPNTFVFQTTTSTDSAIKIELGRPYFANHIEFQLIPELLFGYYVDISRDNRFWNRINDYSTYNCYSKQTLYFEEGFIKYIKIVGMQMASEEKIKFGISNLAVMYSEEVPRFVNGFVAPTENIFYSSKIQINGKLQSSRQTNFTIKPDEIMEITFAQPFLIGSLALNMQKNNYFYIIEMKDGKKIVDQCSRKEGTHQLKFDEIPIIGLNIKDGKGYTILFDNLECPFQLRK